MSEEHPIFELTRGTAPLLVSFPHSGTHVPKAIAERLTDHARTLPDTDWHVPRLYEFLDRLGASRLVATHSRYVVDLNRPPDDETLYPGQKKTGLVPHETFAGQALYVPDETPGGEETVDRRFLFWSPYHEALQAELARIKAAHGYALLWDAHSIESAIPALFDGRLPDFNLGTFDEKSCDPRIAARVFAAAQASGFGAVHNGRFKGGYITRHYGQPAAGVHAIQLEMAQAIYMDEGAPFRFREDKAPKVSTAIAAMIGAYLSAAREFAKG